MRLVAAAVVANVTTSGATARHNDTDLQIAIEWLRETSEHLTQAAPIVSVAERVAALAALPVNGELLPDEREARKFTDIYEFLHSAEPDENFVLKLVDVPYAAVRIYARFILLISRPAVRVLTSEQLKALVAHELAHRHFWTEYYSAQARSAVKELIYLELRCDAIAIVTLDRLSIPPQSLSSALRRVESFNAHFGPALDSRFYPSTAQRERLDEAVAAILRLRRNGMDCLAPCRVNSGLTEFSDRIRKPMSFADSIGSSPQAKRGVDRGSPTNISTR
jgi:hypothetical protein